MWALARGAAVTGEWPYICYNCYFRVSDKVVMSTCGAQTLKPFACKVFVYEGGQRAGRYDPKLSVVFEDVGGDWRVPNGSETV